MNSVIVVTVLLRETAWFWMNMCAEVKFNYCVLLCVACCKMFHRVKTVFLGQRLD